MNAKALVPSKGMAISKLTRIVPYLTPEEVYHIADSCEGRNKERDELLILTLFETGLRVSEAF
jgi:integrase